MEPSTQSPDRGAEPIGWYVHLPFCRSKCCYCDFYSLPLETGQEAGLPAALLHEFALRRPDRLAETIFIGGGTPTVLPHDHLRAILGTLSAAAGPVAEFTMEANPESADEATLGLAVGLGVNRLSLGAQSFVADDLLLLGRCHEPGHIAAAVRAARSVGIGNLNLDLIYAIPGQTLEAWRANIRAVIDLGPEHLSCYALTYEPGTELTRARDAGQFRPVEETLEVEMFELTIEELTAAGYEHYEISNFARPGRACRANLIYWENREYLGIGPSAVSYLDGVRRRNVADVRRYVECMRSDPTGVVEEEETLAPLARAGETAIQMLRLTRGIDGDLFARRTGYDAHALFAEQIAHFTPLGLLQADGHAIRLTRRGLLVANRVMAEFLSH